jgi:hypothetical protein
VSCGRRASKEIGVFGARDPDLLAARHASPLRVAVRLQLRRVGAGRRLGDAEGLQPQLAGRDLRRNSRFCASEPWRSSVPPIVYLRVARARRCRHCG